MTRQFKQSGAALALIALACLAPAGANTDVQTLRAVFGAPLQILDPLSTTAYITRDHGFMIYDTLFGIDSDGQVQPQMVERWSVDAAQTTWTFTLRDGLQFHDGSPVSAADAVASLQRWQANDTLGGKMAARTTAITAIDAQTFQITLSEPFGPMLMALGKPSAIVPFILPKKVLDAAGSGRITQFIGSGPFIFQAQAFRPGERAVYVKNPHYRPRSEPASGTAGGKRVKLDRVELIFLKDAQTTVNALRNKEIDYIDEASFEQVLTMQQDPSLEVVPRTPSRFYVLRFNTQTPPFNDVRARRAAMLAMNQEAIMRVQVGIPGAWERCPSVFPCGSAFASTPSQYTGQPDFAQARKLLAASNYDGTPVVILDTPELHNLSKTAPVVAALLQQAGFKTRLQPLDWASWLQKRTSMAPVSAGGWNLFFAAWDPQDLVLPLASAPLTANGKAGWPGWFEDAAVEALMVDFTGAADLPEQQRIAAAIQDRILSQAAIVPLGQTAGFGVMRKGSLDGLLPRIASTVFWNVQLTGQ